MPRNGVIQTLQPNLGLYLGTARLTAPARALIACRNVRIANGKIVRDAIGWSPFPDSAHAINLDGKPVTLITGFKRRNNPSITIFGNTTDLFKYDSNAVVYLTPQYGTGTIDVTNGSKTVAGTGTSWTANAKAGDFIALGTAENDPAATWYEIDTVDGDTQVTLVDNYAETTQTTQAYTLRQTFTAGDALHPWLDDSFPDGSGVSGGDGDRWYATNGTDPVVAWDGATATVYFPDLGDMDTCQWLRRFKSQMVYGAPTAAGDLRPYSIRWSAVSEPENVVSNGAGEAVVHDKDDPLIAGYVLNDQLVCYGKRTATLAAFVGGDSVYQFRNVIADKGPVSSRAIAPFPSYHQYVTVDGTYVFDGAQAVPVNTHVWNGVIAALSPARLGMVQTAFDIKNGELILVTPLNSDDDPAAGAPELAFVQHYRENVGNNPTPHTLRDLPATAVGYATATTTVTFDSLDVTFESSTLRWTDAGLQAGAENLLFGTIDGDVFILNGADTQNGAGFVSSVQFPLTPLGDVRTKGVVRRVYPFIEPSVTADLAVGFYGADAPDGNTTLLADLTFPLDGTKQFVNPRKVARYGSCAFMTDESYTGYWAMLGYAMEVQPAGAR